MSLDLATPPPPTSSWTEVSARLDTPVAHLPQLSPAERVVAGYLRLGLSNRELAQALGKSEATIKHQVSACLRKCGVPTRAKLITLLR